jgi:hypothetical protein
LDVVICIRDSCVDFVISYSIDVHGIETDSVVPLIGQSAKPPIDEEFLRTYPKRTLDDLPYLMVGCMLSVLRFSELSKVRIGGILPASVIRVLFLILGHIIAVRAR